MEHRLVVEERLGKILDRGFVVHHKNGIKTDNRPENLQVMTIRDHRMLHMQAYRKLCEAEAEIARLRAILHEHNIT